MKVFIVSAMILACAFAAPGVIDNRVESDSSNKMMQYFGSCFETDDITTCLAVKGISALNRAARASNIQITKGVVLARYLWLDYTHKKIIIINICDLWKFYISKNIKWGQSIDDSEKVVKKKLEIEWREKKSRWNNFYKVIDLISRKS